MTAPNIVGVTTITGKTVGVAIGTSDTNIVANAASSNKVLKINALLVSNVDGSAAADITLKIQKGGSTDYHIAKTLSVPADSTLDVLNKSIYLEENDILRALASAASDLEVVCSYEEIS